ncbi:MAG: putative zinc-binding metallopeptidase [Bryobacteraceae bacterium]
MIAVEAQPPHVRLTPANRCHCGRPVFFHNSFCTACHASLGYDTRSAAIIPLSHSNHPPGWLGPDGALLQRCLNFDPAGCNWLIRPHVPHSGLCAACALNRTIPSLYVAGHVERWRRIESAKRRLVASLLRLNLPVTPKSVDTERGLAFDFLAPGPACGPVSTGHSGGVITLNIEEADDAERESVRQQMHEPYRTLLGHLRHEIGHYYWDRLVDGSPLLPPFRDLFGDERANYPAALEKHYRDGPPPGWQHTHVSAYATSHPWEDWAETWSHYLHMFDTINQAGQLGIDPNRVQVDIEPFGLDVLPTEPPTPAAPPFLPMVNDWVRLTVALNELSELMGYRPFYPFVLSRPVVTKLYLVHAAIHRGADG